MSGRDRTSLYSLGTWALIAIAGLLAVVSPTDPDLFWHLKNGEITLASGFATLDAYSYTARGHTWMAHEWPFDIGVYLLTKTFGYRAAVLVAGLLQALGTWTFVRLARERGASHALTVALTAIFLVFIAPTWGVRAQLATTPMAGAFYFVLLGYRKNPQKPKILWVLPPLMFVWTNLHASFPLGFSIFGFFLFGAVAERFLYRTPKGMRPIRPLAVTFAACTLVTLVNPVGLKLWTYPLPYLFSSTSYIQVVAEWQSIDFHDPLKLVFAVVLCVIGILGIGRPVTLATRRRFRLRLRSRFNLTDVALLVFATTMALRYSRLLPLYGLLILPLLGEIVARTWPALSRRAEYVAARPSVAKPFDYVLVGLVVAGFALVVIRAPDAQLGSAPRTDARFPYPVDAATFLANVAGDAPQVFNEYVWGGYLLYRLYPRGTIFIDGRADLFRERVFDEYTAIHELGPHYLEGLEKSGTNYVLLPPDAHLATALSAQPGWRRVFADKIAVVYERVPDRAL